MTLLDALAVLVVAAYAALGMLTGTVRRVIGLIGAYLALLIATNMGQQGGGVFQQYSPTTSVTDARLYGWLFFFFLLLLVFEGMAAAVGSRLQVAVLAFDRLIGTIVGLLTGGVVAVAVTYMLVGYSEAAGGQPTQLQSNLRPMVANSTVAIPFARSSDPLLRTFFYAALPRDAHAYFAFEGPH